MLDLAALVLFLITVTGLNQVEEDNNTKTFDFLILPNGTTVMDKDYEKFSKELSDAIKLYLFCITPELLYQNMYNPPTSCRSF